MELIDLSHFGWDGLTIPSDLNNLCKYLPTYKHLKILRSPQRINGSEILFPYKFFKKDGKAYMPAFIKGDLHTDGGYAQVYKAKRAIFEPSSSSTLSGNIHLVKKINFTEICIKELVLNITPDEDSASPQTREKSYEDEINAILYEAFIHALLYKTFEYYGYESAIPYMYDIVANTKNELTPTSPTDFESVWITMEFIHGNTLENVLKKRLIPLSSNSSLATMKHNELLLLDVFIQIAFYLHILQEKLQFNHRDLKINNIYIRHQDADWSRVLTIPNIGSWTCKNDVVLIDFGFSCIACGSGFTNPRATLLGAGSWFKSEDDCLKYGRDLGQFIYSLHASFPLTNYVSPVFFNIIHNCMMAKKYDKTIDLFMGIDGNGTPIEDRYIPKRIIFNDGIYKFLRANDVDIPGCRPYTFLERLTQLLPTKKTV